MAEQFLNVVHIRTAAEQPGRAAATEGVRGDADVDAGLAGIGVQPSAKGVVGGPKGSDRTL